MKKHGAIFMNGGLNATDLQKFALLDTFCITNLRK